MIARHALIENNVYKHFVLDADRMHTCTKLGRMPKITLSLLK